MAPKAQNQLDERDMERARIQIASLPDNEMINYLAEFIIDFLGVDYLRRLSKLAVVEKDGRKLRGSDAVMSEILDQINAHTGGKVRPLAVQIAEEVDRRAGIKEIVVHDEDKVTDEERKALLYLKKLDEDIGYKSTNLRSILKKIDVWIGYLEHAKMQREEKGMIFIFNKVAQNLSENMARFDMVLKNTVMKEEELKKVTDSFMEGLRTVDKEMADPKLVKDLHERFRAAFRGEPPQKTEGLAGIERDIAASPEKFRDVLFMQSLLSTKLSKAPEPLGREVYLECCRCIAENRGDINFILNSYFENLRKMRMDIDNYRGRSESILKDILTEFKDISDEMAKKAEKKDITAEYVETVRARFLKIKNNIFTISQDTDRIKGILIEMSKILSYIRKYMLDFQRELINRLSSNEELRRIMGQRGVNAAEISVPEISPAAGTKEEAEVEAEAASVPRAA